MKIFKFLADLHRFLHRMPKDQLVEAEYISCGYIEKKFGTGINYRPAGYRSTDRTGRPAGSVRSELFRPVPVPVMKNPDRFHLCLSPLSRRIGTAILNRNNVFWACFFAVFRVFL
jgi:hypothetical protein